VLHFCIRVNNIDVHWIQLLLLIANVWLFLQALGSLYFIHHSVTAVEMFDFHG